MRSVYKKHKVIISMSILIISIMLISLVTYSIDVDKAKNNIPPKFTLKTVGVNDGGTKIYYGLGYQIIFWRIMAEDLHYYYVGVEYHYLFDMVNVLSDDPSIDLELVRLND